MLEFILISSVKVVVVMVVLLTCCAYATYMERKVLAFMQNRIGPNYAGPFGILQPIADGIKLIFKAPMISFVPAMLTFAVVPFSSNFTLFGYKITGVISDLNIGILFVFAITSLGVYGVLLGGWSAGSMPNWQH